MSASHLQKSAFNISLFTFFYNFIEGILFLVIGWLSNSIGLIGFGADSLIESFSGGVMVWRFRKNHHSSKVEKEEINALRLLSLSYFLVGGYVAYESIQKLLRSEPSNPGLLGLVLTGVSLLVMLYLYVNKILLAEKLKSKSLALDAKQSLYCMILSVIMVGSILLTYFYSVWWADGVAGIIISLMVLKEGWGNLFG